MKTMRAVRPAPDGQGVRLQTVALPQTGPEEVLVELGASAIDPLESLETVSERTLGRDFAGVVISDGEWAGKEVWGSGNGFGVDRDGAQADYVSVPTSWLSEKPPSLGMGPAAAVGAPFIAAWAALAAARLQPGETVLILGASTPLGRATALLARVRKVKVIGADMVALAPASDAYIDLRVQGLSAEVRALTDDQGVEVVIDTLGGALFSPSLGALARDGRYILLAGQRGACTSFDLSRFHSHRHRLIAVDPSQLSGIEIAEILDQLRALFDASLLAPPPSETWPLDQAPAAYAAAQHGGWPRHVLTAP
ncbi:zinc-binding alcohol dehydrogenase family protein [Caulobacter sp. CCNWLY153]|uniref:Enoyl reductase (ER) domain-containing protein n=1 Tax=Caulobacter radicis TaxID=2172650 RepID=A0A2T9IYT3_9CAUL|nr:zinc-binding alcohol dehydrogenase family protein [Caulobacter radicis]PVM72364.1 hypothetical protein DDF65_22585 [Caulobacter radicis]